MANRLLADEFDNLHFDRAKLVYSENRRFFEYDDCKYIKEKGKLWFPFFVFFRYTVIMERKFYR